MFYFIDRRYIQDDHTIPRNISRLERVELLIKQVSNSDIHHEAVTGGGIAHLVVELYKGSTKLFVDGIKEECQRECEEAVWSIIDEFGDYEFVYTVLRFGLVGGNVFPSSMLQRLFGILTPKKTKEVESRISRQFKAKAKKMGIENYLVLLSEPKPKEKRDLNRELIGRTITVIDKMSSYYGVNGTVKDVKEGAFLLTINDIDVVLNRNQFKVKKYGYRKSSSTGDKTRIKVWMLKKGIKAFRL